MTSLAITPRSVEQVLHLGDHRYFIATPAEVSGIEGVRRSWDVRRVPRQDGDPAQEFTLPLSDFSKGYGYTFAQQAGVYEIADGWDLSAPGKAITWDKITTAAAVTSTNYRGWLFYQPSLGYMYMLRGSYATKYQPVDSTTEWPILERHYFGANVVVAGRPAEFQGKLYVPLVDLSTPGVETLARWHELDTISVTVTETQLLTQSGSPTGGTFVLRFADGLTTTDTSALAWDISAASMQTALRLIPGLEGVTVTRTGTSNFVWTVVMTGAPSAIGTTSPPQFTLQTNSLTGGSTPTVTPSTSVAGVGDRWDRSDAGREARTFCTWQKPTVGPVLVRANANKVSSCATTPTTAANWGTEYDVGDSGAKITALTTIGRLLIVGKEDGIWSGDESSQFQNELSDIHDIVSPQNCVGMRVFQGYLLIPHLIGLIRWRPGDRWRLIGAEQEGAYEGERTTGWGTTASLVPYGKYLYQTVNDTRNGIGIVGSLQAPASERGPLTPHMHHAFDAFVEDCAVIGIGTQPVIAHTPDTWSDDPAVGTRTWSNPANAASDSAYASATLAGITHYLKGLNPNPAIPAAATVKRVRLSLKRLAYTPATVTTFNYTGAEQTYVVPAGVTSLIVDVRGAQGGGPSSFYPGKYGTGGNGGRVQTTITVTPGETLRIYVGGLPTLSGYVTYVGGYNGGGNGGGDAVAGTYKGQGGGGASDIRQGGAALANRIVVAGGGGGGGMGGDGGGNESIGGGGGGGGATGGAGGNSTRTGLPTAGGGGGGTASTGGVGPGDGEVGTLGVGGDGGDPLDAYITAGGGGGGGYYGGGGGQEGFTTPTPEFGPAGGGGGGSSYSVGTGTVHTQGYQSGNGQIIITPYSPTDITDVTVKLVKGGAVVGTNLAKTGQWPIAATEATYDFEVATLGTTLTAADVNASNFGFVLSANVQAGEARVSLAKMYIEYTVAGVQDPGSFLAVITLDSTRTTATPYIYKLPRAGMPVANDPNIDKAVSDKTFKTPRYANPHRNTQKIYRSFEFYVDLDPETNTPGFEVWASVEDGPFLPLLDAGGAPATITISGAYELNFPETAQSVGRWVQFRPTVPALSGTQVPVAVDLRDPIAHGSWLPKMTDEINVVLVLRPGVHQDGYNEQRTPEEQYRDIEDLMGPRRSGSGPIFLHDPVSNEDTRCVVSSVAWREERFKEKSNTARFAMVTLRKTPYDAS